MGDSVRRRDPLRSELAFTNVRKSSLTLHGMLEGFQFFFLGRFSAWGGIRACFFETGTLLDSLAFFGSPRIPLGISVKDRVLEIVG